MVQGWESHLEMVTIEECQFVNGLAEVVGF